MTDTSRALVAAVAFTLTLAGPAAAAAATPHEVVEESAEALFAVVRDARAYAEADEERFFREVEAVLAPVVDFDGIARSVMAVHYKSATDEQRQRFADVFKWGLVRAYAGALLGIADDEEQFVVLPPGRPPKNPRRQSVNMEVTGSNGRVYPVVYSMVDLGDEGGWRMRNLIIDGINLGLTYRSQFASAMKEDASGSGIDGVIDGWADSIKTVGSELETETGGAGS